MSDENYPEEAVRTLGSLHVSVIPKIVCIQLDGALNSAQCSANVSWSNATHPIQGNSCEQLTWDIIQMHLIGDI